MGRAIFPMVQAQQASEKKLMVDRLENVFQHLHPVANQPIRAKLESFVDDAIFLANKKTLEHAWFRCRIVDSGVAFDERYMTVPPDQTGRVLMCTFPAFSRKMVDPVTGASRMQILVQHSVELESHFM
jgi:hypothetical protein